MATKPRIMERNLRALSDAQVAKLLAFDIMIERPLGEKEPLAPARDLPREIQERWKP